MVEKACTVPSSAIRMQKNSAIVWNERTFKYAERWRGASLRKCGHYGPTSIVCLLLLIRNLACDHTRD